MGESHGLMGMPGMGMPGIGFFGLLVIGFLAGYVAGKTMNREHGFLINILVGIAGAFVGGTIAGIAGISFYGFLGNLVVAILGAILILWIFGRSAPRRTR
ncbi:GlsB/YeaQ/YmgE family stress response membrane protein [Nitratireductor aquimarinus]|uniref:GlsB/YeaQ/YmgE family stress response membrane protein n=1 Tax=Nitratireductor aquimarinus TaxID=889300 RepID=A0ABU4AKP2_9HYPH|nr:GlsB/YeaQ/YmgE family stress response membrane protein [Nitratireductor aquimarinus]MDV6226775.1 GlsB/YeaQ/YmgE family stress response membrane protein [Nitratireductor aquimarinus]